ncbi:MAG: hypothetical protein AAB557_06330 [Patescibacteria group bacterium]
MGDSFDRESEISRADPRLFIFQGVVHLLQENADKVSFAQKPETYRQFDATLRPSNASEDILHLNVTLDEEGDRRTFDIRLSQGKERWKCDRQYRLEATTSTENGRVKLSDDFGETTMSPEKILVLITDAAVQIPYWAEGQSNKFSTLSDHLNTLPLLQIR